MRLIDADLLEPDADYDDGEFWAVSITQIHNAPTITLERKRGRWIPQDHNKRNGYVTTTVYYYPVCSVCGKTGNYSMNFCPNCGAEMTEDEA